MKNLFLKLSVIFLFFFSSCQKDHLDDISNMAQTQEGWEKKELLNMGFSNQDIEEFEDYFVVEKDIVITKSSFIATHEDHDPNSIEFRQRRPSFLVDQSILSDVRVLIDPGFTGNWPQLIQESLDNWNNANTPVTFRVVTSNPHITIYPDTSLSLPFSHWTLSSSVCGKGKYPDANGNPGDIISINIDSPHNPDDDQRIRTITHEFGHNIGLAHTNSNLTTDFHITCTPTIDTESIMNGNECGRNVLISPEDEYAVRKLYACSNWGGWTDPEDLSLVGDVDGDGKEELVLINTSYTGGAIRTIDLINGNELNWINHGNFQGWMDPTDRVFLADANGDGKVDLIFQNTNYIDGAIRVVDLNSGNNINSISHGSFQGWMDDTDKSFTGDADGDGRDDLILINVDPGNTNGAIWVIDLLTGNTITTINHGSFQGWMGTTDKMFLGDANGDGTEDLILQNTSYTDGAFRIVDLVTGLNINNMNHNDPLAAFQGWMDDTDKSFSADANGDGRDDLILVNVNPNDINGAIRVVDLMTNNTITTVNHGSFGGWMNTTDKMFLGDANGDGAADLVLQNTAYAGGALRIIDLVTGLNINTISHGTFGGWMDSPDYSQLCDNNGDGSKGILFINKDPDKCGGVFRVVDLISESDLLWVDYCD